MKTSKKSHSEAAAIEQAQRLDDGGFNTEYLLRLLRDAISAFPDKRTGKNLRYSMMDIGLGAFSVFFTQTPSFLAYQRHLEKINGTSNAQTLFEMTKIPTDNHIRDMLDPIAPKYLNSVYASVFEALKEGDYLESYRSLNNTILVAIDGTQYHSSKKIHCADCNCKTHKNGTKSYSHTVVTPVIVASGKSQVFPMEPEFVTPQDGNTKQDCENEAAKRWIEEFGERCRKLGVTILGDDLYCHQPFCKLLLKKGLSFIFSCKPDSHKTLYEWVTELDGLNDVQTITVKRRHGKKRFIDTYRFVNQVPIRDGDDALMVNWCEITTATESDGKILYHNAFATNCEINNDNVAEIVEAGRTRWKIENENNNTLKTKGYHLTHNYGHGKQHLSSLLCSMIIMAFLFHTLLEIDDELYRLIRQKISRRDAFFNDLRALTGYLCFNSWHALFYFMLRGRERRFTLEELFDTS